MLSLGGAELGVHTAEEKTFLCLPKRIPERTNAILVKKSELEKKCMLVLREVLKIDRQNYSLLDVPPLETDDQEISLSHGGQPLSSSSFIDLEISYEICAAIPSIISVSVPVLIGAILRLFSQ